MPEKMMKEVSKFNKKVMIIVAITIASVLALVLAITVPTRAEAQRLAEQLDLGEKYLSELNYEQAIVAYLKAIEIDPKCEDAYLALADIYIITEDFEKAEEILRQAEKELGESVGWIREKLMEVGEERKKAAEITSDLMPDNTPIPEPTLVNISTPAPTDIPILTQTNKPEPTVTSVPEVLATNTPIPTNTPVPTPTEVLEEIPSTPAPLATPTPISTPEPTPTDVPKPTNTPVLTPTNTPIPKPTNTPIPTPTNTPTPTGTPAPEPSKIPFPSAAPVPTAEPIAFTLPEKDSEELIWFEVEQDSSAIEITVFNEADRFDAYVSYRVCYVSDEAKEIGIGSVGVAMYASNAIIHDHTKSFFAEKAGIYLVYISNSVSYNPYYYSGTNVNELQITYRILPPDGNEPNNEIENATEVKCGEYVFFNLLGESDNDWFQFYVEEGVNEIEITIGSESGRFDAALGYSISKYDEETEEIQTIHSIWGVYASNAIRGTTTRTFTVDGEGMYYINVANAAARNSHYYSGDNQTTLYILCNYAD